MRSISRSRSRSPSPRNASRHGRDRPPARRRILYVGGLYMDVKAREVGYEFEYYGPIVRCDIPMPRDGLRNSRELSAFVEFEDSRDAEDAYHDMHKRKTPVGRLHVEWARKPPPTMVRHHGSDSSHRRNSEKSPPRRDHRDRSISRSPPRQESPVYRNYEKSPPRRQQSPPTPPPTFTEQRSPSPMGWD